jgi:hypothetical protein
MKNYLYKILYPISTAIGLASQNSKGKYENRKILDFVKNILKKI